MSKKGDWLVAPLAWERIAQGGDLNGTWTLIQRAGLGEVRVRARSVKITRRLSYAEESGRPQSETRQMEVLPLAAVRLLPEHPSNNFWKYGDTVLDGDEARFEYAGIEFLLPASVAPGASSTKDVPFNRFTPDAELQRWYRTRIQEAPSEGYSREDDEEAGRKVGIGRDMVRSLRKELAPDDWQSAGRKQVR